MELKELSEQIKQTFETYKSVVVTAEQKADKALGERAQDKEKIAQLEAKLSALDIEHKGALDRVGKLETANNRSDIQGIEAKSKEQQALQIKAFDTLVRKGKGAITPEEVKLLSTDSNVDGGFLLPANKDSNIRQKLRETSPIRQLVTVLTISKGNDLELPVEDTDYSFAQGGERSTRSETNTGTISLEKIPTHGYNAQPKLTQWMLDDMEFNWESYANDKVVSRIGRAQNTDYIIGTGFGEPKGLTLEPTSRVTQVDITTSSAIDPVKVMTLFYDHPAPYANAGTWAWHRTTTGLLRKLKFAIGSDSVNWMWQPGLSAGEPSTFLGRPYVEMVDMPIYTAGSNNICMVFGDFKSAYVIVDKVGTTFIRDNVTAKGFVLLYHEVRSGGQVVLPEAIRYAKAG